MSNQLRYIVMRYVRLRLPKPAYRNAIYYALTSAGLCRAPWRFVQGLLTGTGTPEGEVEAHRRVKRTMTSGPRVGASGEKRVGRSDLQGLKSGGWGLGGSGLWVEPQGHLSFED